MSHFTQQLDAALDECVIQEGIKKALVGFFKKFLEFHVTFTAGGGPGVGYRLRGTPLIADIDPTGPGTGVLIDTSTFAKILNKIPLKYTKEIANKINEMPGKVYVGVEAVGIIPVPFVGGAGSGADAKKIIAFFKQMLKKEGTPAKTAAA